MVNNGKNTKQKVKWFVKTLKWLILGIVSLIMLIVGGVYYIYNYYDWQSVVRDLVHKHGSSVVGTDVNVGNIKLSLTDGHGSVGNITVSNPKGYSQSYIIKLGGVSVKVDKDSVIKLAKETAQKNGPSVKTIVINEIQVNKPEVAYELMNLKRSNADDIMANIKKNTASTGKKQSPQKAGKSGVEYKVAIKKVVIANGSATVAANLLGASQSLKLNLPTITINNLGTEKQGVTIEDGLARIFQEILKTTTTVVSKADLSGILSDVGNLAGTAADVAGKTAKDAIGTVGKTADAATEKVTEGVKGLTNGIGSLF